MFFDNMIYTDKFRFQTPIYEIGVDELNNHIFVKRDDLFPFSFGGNKSRKAVNFLRDIKEKQCDTVVTYGSSSSNHCRVIANMASSNGLKCYIITPEEAYKETINSKLVDFYGAVRIKTSLDSVVQTISEIMDELSKTCNPYFIQGGGHGNLGTKAYHNVYNEIVQYETEEKIQFSYIFHASGTGTTQAGLVSGLILNNDYWRNIIGISIARKNPRGRDVVIESVNDYLNDGRDHSEEIKFTDKYICGGYGKYNEEIKDIIRKVSKHKGMPLNLTYTGKAYYGMTEYIKENNINNQNILFINTGGAPLYFDDLEDI